MSITKIFNIPNVICFVIMMAISSFIEYMLYDSNVIYAARMPQHIEELNLWSVSELKRLELSLGCYKLYFGIGDDVPVKITELREACKLVARKRNKKYHEERIKEASERHRLLR